METKSKNGQNSLSSKKKWIDMEITRVKLNPEQAVLACCNTNGNKVATSALNCNGCTGLGGANDLST